jgi:hypothetical protein
MPTSYKKGDWGDQVSSVREAVKKMGSWNRVAREPSLREDERGNRRIPTVKAVTRERLVRTQHAGEDLACAVII